MSSSSHRDQAIQSYGWTAVPSSADRLLAQYHPISPPTTGLPFPMPLPSSALASAVRAYAQEALPSATYNHSMRAFAYGLAILQHVFTPSWLSSSSSSSESESESFIETYFLACLLHDIGTTDKNIHATLLSFEFYGGRIALDLLTELGAPIEQAESVSEAIIRHQDLGETGTLTRITALLQLATIFDNMGGHPELVSKETIENAVKAYPRKQWSSCFAATIRKENDLKPWAHTTHLGEEDFPVGVQGNALMAPYDDLE